MIKSESPHMQAVRQSDEILVPDERRAELAQKGRRLYSIYCGTKGSGICAESFAEYHIWRGELAVARDLLAYLREQADSLGAMNDSRSQARLAMTVPLIMRIENLLGEPSLAPGSD